MKIGMICRYDNSGLGTLSREFSEHLKPSKILLVQNGVFQTFPERYNNFNTRVINVNNTITYSDMEWFFKDIDIILSFETFYNWGLVLMARRKGIKTVLVTMFEMSLSVMPDYPDLLICPSKLDYLVFEKYKDKCRVEYLPIPMNTERLSWQKRELANVFVHVASHGGVSGRKGTKLLLEAMKYVKSNIKLKIYTWKNIICSDPRVEIKIVNFKNYWQCWEEGDVLIYPQDYNGICLPVMEAFTRGFGVISTDIFPFNEYLPKDLLFKPKGFYRTTVERGCIEVDAAEIDPKDIAAKIDEYASKDISKYSLEGKKWAEENSWESLLPKYDELLQNI